MHSADSVGQFVASCEKTYIGGFSKTPDAHPDILHSFYSLCYRSLTRNHGLRLLNVTLGTVEDKFV